MFTMVHKNYKKVSAKEMRDTIYDHLYNMNINQLIREQKVITDVWQAICRETAFADLSKIIISGNLRQYYQRLINKAV